MDDRKLRRSLRLPFEEVGDGADGVELELLVRVELELHRFSALLNAWLYAVMQRRR